MRQPSRPATAPSGIERHYFMFEGHRHPGDLHVHYFGGCSLSFGAGFQPADGDKMMVEFNGFVRPPRNPLRVAAGKVALIGVQPLT